MMLSTKADIGVGLGELYVTSDPAAVLVCYGLGSCVAVCAYDPAVRIGAMAHIVLPTSSNGASPTLPAKFADTGIPVTIEKMESAGAKRSRIIIKIAGGARMLRGVKTGSTLDIGERNLVAVYGAIDRLGLKIQAQDTGGDWGRCLWLHVDNGLAQVRTAGQVIVDL